MGILSISANLSDATPKEYPMKKITARLMIAAALLSTFALSGCNTVRGIGQDVQRAGSAVSNAAQ
jgi:predicted small secreted protein